MSNFFYSFYRYFIKRKRVLAGLLFILFGGLIYLSLQLELEEDISKLIPQSEESKTLNRVLKNTDFSDKIIVNISLIENGTTDDLTSYANELIDSIQLKCKDYILNIQGKIADDDLAKTMDFIYSNLPIFLEQTDYDYLYNKIDSNEIDQLVENNYKTLISPSGILAKKMIRKDPFNLTFRGLRKLEELKITDDFDIYNGYIVTKNKRNLLLFIKPSLPTNETDENSLFVDKLYAIAGSLNKKYNQTVTSEYFGSTVIAVSNANQIKTDIKYTVSIALTILLFILIFFYKRFTIPILLFIPAIIGALIAIVSLHFLRDTISAISLGIGSILLGITLDYSLHILTHFRKNNNVEQLYQDISKPILMSSITTSTAFLCLLFLKSQALQDLGIFAAISVFSASIFALFLIPLLYNPDKNSIKSSTTWIEKIGAYSFEKNKFFIAGFVLLFILSLFTYKNVKFNKDLNKMNYRSEATISAEHHLDSILKLSAKSIYIVAYGENLENVLDANTKVNQALKKAKLSKQILHYSSNGSIVLSLNEQQKKIKQWNLFWTDSIKNQMKNQFIENGRKYGFKANTYAPFYNLLNKEFKPVEIKDYSKIKSLLTQEYISDTSAFKTAVSLIKIKESQKEILAELIADIPNTILIDRKRISETFLGGLKDDFSSLINYSFAAIVIILLLFYRNIELTLLTVIPIILTWILTMGVMGFFGIEFTIFNVIITTFIFGLGVDYSIFVTNALVKDYTYGTKEIITYKVSILLSVVTTLLGVGVLIFAKHPALRSISILSLTGILITVFVAFTIQPILFKLFVIYRGNRGFSPLKVRPFLLSLLLLVFYSLGGILLSLLSVIILPLIPISKKIKFKTLHKSMAILVQSVLYANPFVRKKVINEYNETFKKPAIIIANHSSSLDTLTLGLATHKLIYLVNDWVYKSPIFGILAKVAGFYPVSKGVDDGFDHLNEKAKQGYSLVVFPEAKRSFTNKVGRFHKGAFFLQEQLKLDILPIYLHGNAEVMQKGDFIINDGSLTVKIGKRIEYNDKQYGLTSRERTKNIGKYFKNILLNWRDQIENENYFKEILFSNYLYKEKKIQRIIKSDFNENKAIYHSLNSKVPMKSKIFHLADDYGQINILLVSKSLDRKITTFIGDKQKSAIAKNCYTCSNRKVKYVSKIDKDDIKKMDCLLLTSAMSIQFIDNIDLTTFERIVCFDQEQIINKISKSGFKISYSDKKIVCFDN